MAKPTDQNMKDRYANLLSQGFDWTFEPSRADHRALLAVAQDQVYHDSPEDRRSMYGVLDSMATSLDFPLGFSVKRSDDGKRENDVYTLNEEYTKACKNFAELTLRFRPFREAKGGVKVFKDHEKAQIKAAVKALKTLLTVDPDLDMIPDKVKYRALGAGEKAFDALAIKEKAFDGTVNISNPAKDWAVEQIEQGESYATACKRLATFDAPKS